MSKLYNAAVFQLRMPSLSVATLLLLASINSACTHDPSPVSPPPTAENSIAAFLTNAERQSETDNQRREIQRALRDMLDKSAVELPQARYADYAGTANTWSITELLQHYFVPNPPSALDEKRSFEDLGDPAARAAIQHQLDEVSRTLQ
ncbi:MAG TPA: hypothetical protein VE422_50445 [Terriglobia bacterium]|nr:hypothetical protein [Terriglobia bacterium]